MWCVPLVLLLKILTKSISKKKNPDSSPRMSSKTSVPNMMNPKFVVYPSPLLFSNSNLCVISGTPPKKAKKKTKKEERKNNLVI